jgi:heme oxygenase
MGSARAHLANATADIHQALHGAEPFARIARGEIGLAGYGALLDILYRYHGGMAALCETGARTLNLPELVLAHHDRIARLKDDLAFLEAGSISTACEPARDSDFAIGCLYTVLGSTLGGKVISRQLEDLLPDGQGRSFFAGSARDGAHWRLFCARLEESSLVLSALESGARHAFARFASLIEDWRDLRRERCAPAGAAGRRISSPQTG